MRKVLSLVASLGLLLAASQAVAASLQRGDQLHYQITTPEGRQVSVTAVFISPTEMQNVGGDVTVRRNKAGNRLESRGITFTPHNGEFPDDGHLTVGMKWTTRVGVQEADGDRFKHERSCSALEEGTIETAGLEFVGAVKVVCERRVSGGETAYETTTTWYWEDAAGNKLLLSRVTQNVQWGAPQRVKLHKIDSETLLVASLPK